MERVRFTWRHPHGLTNVWPLAPLHGVERVKGTMRLAAPRVHNPGSLSAAHLNQKPLAFMRRIRAAVTAEGDVVWEPFGGLASASVAAIGAGRFACVAKSTTTSPRSPPSASTTPQSAATPNPAARLPPALRPPPLPRCGSASRQLR